MLLRFPSQNNFKKYLGMKANYHLKKQASLVLRQKLWKLRAHRLHKKFFRFGLLPTRFSLAKIKGRSHKPSLVNNKHLHLAIKDNLNKPNKLHDRFKMNCTLKMNSSK